MAHRIEVFYKTADTRSLVLTDQLKALGFKLTDIHMVDAYIIDKPLTASDLAKVCQMLVNPVVQRSNIESFNPPEKFDYVLEIGFLPGVTDNVGSTVKESIEDLLKIKFATQEHVYSSQILYLSGILTDADIQKLADSLFNPLIQRVQIKSFDQFNQNEGLDIIVPRVKLTGNSRVEEINLEISDDELVKLSKTRTLALSLNYLKTIRAYFRGLNRNPNDIELESLAQTWSEHCKHTIFRNPIDDLKQGLFKQYIKGATEKINSKICVSVFTDNSGAIEFDENFLITDKAETHNSPSALDPYGGAITGIVGVNRDCIGFGMGAKPIINRFGFCFGLASDNALLFRDKQKSKPMLSPKRIFSGVSKGVNSGGNCSGIPTPQGFTIFDPSYKGKPLVFVGTIGLIPRKINNKPSWQKKARPGDYIVMIGGRVGKDGIHGATFSSESLTGHSPATAVQIGDPITQKKFSDALIKEARNLSLYNSITDDGAGGLSCSVSEMAKESGGCEVDLEKVPLKYSGLYPWEIWISESQERMTLSVPTKKWESFKDLLEKRGVEATVIGKFTDSGKCIVKYDANVIVDLDMDFLHEGLPSENLQTKSFTVKLSKPKIPKIRSFNKIILDILRKPNIASCEHLFMRYDHEVQAGSITKPLQGAGRVVGDSAICRPILSSTKAIIFSQSALPWYSLIDSYHMTSCTIDTAIRKAIASGADLNHLALLDNFCWSSGNDPKSLWQLKQAAKACFDTAVSFGTPFISGKDSMFNDFSGFDENGRQTNISVLPTLLISTIAVMQDYSKAVTIDAKIPGDLVYVLGDTFSELGASEFHYLFSKKDLGMNVPTVKADKNKRLYESLSQCTDKQLLASCVSLNRGGLSVGLARSAMAGKLGMEISLEKISQYCKFNHEILFSESVGRFLVTVNPKNKTSFEKIMKNQPYYLLGNIQKKQKLIIKNIENRVIADLKITEMLDSYKSTFKDF